MNIKTAVHLLRSVLIVLLLMGVTVMLFGCGKQKYKLNLDAGFESKKTQYGAGDKVTVYYDFIATDTDYHFYSDSDDVELKQDYDDKHGYVFTFTMPAHDVTLYVESHNSMVYIPELTVSFVSEMQEADLWLLPDTEANRKTTLWGTATVANIEPGETYDVELGPQEDGSAWMLRMIDVDHMYYEFNDIQLEDGCVLRLYEGDPGTIYLEVTYTSGKEPVTYTGFYASL